MIENLKRRLKASAAVLLVVAAAGSGAGYAPAAMAADLGGGRPVQPPADFEPPIGRASGGGPNWSGFYFGAGLGYGTGDTGVTGDSGNFTFDQDGALWSAFAGYNWQYGNSVLGLEADIGSGNMAGTAISGGNRVSTDLSSIGSLRGRYGYLVGPKLMLYGTAGFAWANYDFEHIAGQDKSETLLGYQLGGGAELMFAPNWTLRLEYLYTDLSPERVAHQGIQNRYDPDFHTVRAGIALKF